MVHLKIYTHSKWIGSRSNIHNYMPPNSDNIYIGLISFISETIQLGHIAP